MANSLGYTLEIVAPIFSSGPDFNVPILKLTNNSTSASLVEFDITIGDTSFNFDEAVNDSPSISTLVPTLNTPDRDGGGGIRSDNINYTFTGFTPGEFFQFDTDIDLDDVNSGEDFRQVLFDLNGSNSSDNSVVTVTFSDGTVLSGQLPDFAQTVDEVYTFSQLTTPDSDDDEESAPLSELGYILEFSTPDFNQPWMKITNTSTFNSIVDFTLTIGDTNFNFDAVAFNSVKSSGITETLISPDFDFNGGVRSDELAYLFNGFEPGTFFQAIDVDFDIDNVDSFEDYRQILFDLNGSDSSDNAEVSVTFSDGTVLSGQLPDFAQTADEIYTFSQSTFSNVFALEAELDSSIRTDLNARRNDNYGRNKTLIVGTGRGGGGIPFGGADAMRSLLQFDLSNIPTETVESATLELTLFGYDNGSPSTQYIVDVHRILDPWEEGNGYEGPSSTTIGAPPDAVWVDPADGVAWAGAGDNSDPDAANNQTQPDFDPVAVASTVIEQDTDIRGEVIQWDITSLVNDWLEGTVPNNGILLRDTATDGTFRGVNFGSREGDFWNFPGTSPEPVTGPRLVISPSPLDLDEDDDESSPPPDPDEDDDESPPPPDPEGNNSSETFASSLGEIYGQEDSLFVDNEVEELPWDIDGNGLITPTDAMFALNRLGLSMGDYNFDPIADLDSNGTITSTDAIAIINHLGLSVFDPI